MCQPWQFAAEGKTAKIALFSGKTGCNVATQTCTSKVHVVAPILMVDTATNTSFAVAASTQTEFGDDVDCPADNLGEENNPLDHSPV